MSIMFNKRIVHNPQIGGTKIKRIMVGSTMVWPTGEAWIDWPYYTDERYSSVGSVNGMGEITELSGFYKGYAPLFSPGYSPNITNPFWGTVAYDESNILSVRTSLSQSETYRITGSIDIIKNNTNNPDIYLTSTIQYGSIGGTTYNTQRIYVGSIPVGRWITIPIDVTVTHTNGYIKNLYPVVYTIPENSGSDAYSFRFANIRIGIQRFT